MKKIILIILLSVPFWAESAYGIDSCKDWYIPFLLEKPLYFDEIKPSIELKESKELTETVKSVGVNHIMAQYLVDTCTRLSDGFNCIRLGSAITVAEQGGCKKKSNNCFGQMNGKSKPTKLSSIDQWVPYYNRKLKGKSPKDLYGKNNTTHYCTAETSSKTKGWCPNGLKHANGVWNLFYKFTIK